MINIFLIVGTIFSTLAFANEDPLLNAAKQELDRTYQFLQKQKQPAYWIGLGITDVRNHNIQASNGAVMYNHEYHRRYADIDLRVGDFQLDNTRQLRDAGWFNEDTHFHSGLSIETKPIDIRTSLWRLFDEAYRSSVRRLIKIKANSVVKVELEDKSDDFSKAPAIKDLQVVSPQKLSAAQQKSWEERLRKASAILLGYPDVIDSGVQLTMEDQILYLLNTEGTMIRHQRTQYRISVWAYTMADDGMELNVYDYIDAAKMEALPSPEEFEKMVLQTAQKAVDLKNAPKVDPYVGPAILRGRASAVFFHEILGHRVEGHRQKDEFEGQTLGDKVNQQIFPDFISIIDNPTLASFNGVDLNGYYKYDDEGTPAQKVEVVKDGVFLNFLMSRTPIEGFPQTNGHGRRDIGYAPVSRQGNLIISASRTSSYKDLRNQLIKQIRKQNKPFGLIFDDISGGFTFTGRNTPNSYNVKPVTVWKVFPDGRPDQLVRGVDMIGTPLLTFGRITAASDEYQVFNGSCGAESGWVPVSAIAPDVLVSEVEVQLKTKGSDRPPLLQSPKIGGEK